MLARRCLGRGADGAGVVESSRSNSERALATATGDWSCPAFNGQVVKPVKLQTTSNGVDHLRPLSRDTSREAHGPEKPMQSTDDGGELK